MRVDSATGSSESNSAETSSLEAGSDTDPRAGRSGRLGSQTSANSTGSSCSHW